MIFFLPIFVPLLKCKKKLKKIDLPLFEDIHLRDFSEKHPKNADLFFLSENGGGIDLLKQRGRGRSRVFFSTFFFIHPRKTKNLQTPAQLKKFATTGYTLPLAPPRA